MIKAQRQKKLVELLESNQLMSIADLSEKLNTSLMTIRRDLDYLEQKGIVKRVHGGAFLVKHDINQPSFQERLEEFSNEKLRIGKTAAELIEDGSIVFFDAGTTPLAMIEYIPQEVQFTAITTGLMTAIALCNKPNINIISVGGNIHRSSYSATNYMSIELIKKFNADIAFISTKAFYLPYGTYEAQLPLIEVKKAIVSVSNKVILLADHSKFETKSLCLSVPIDDIDMIITDNSVSEETINEIKKLGKEIILT